MFRYVSIDDTTGQRTVQPVSNLHGIVHFEFINDPNPTTANAVCLLPYYYPKLSIYLLECLCHSHCTYVKSYTFKLVTNEIIALYVNSSRGQTGLGCVRAKGPRVLH